MSGSMPYLLDKGPYFSVIESILDNRGVRRTALIELRKGFPGPQNPGGSRLADLCGFDSENLGNPANPTTGVQASGDGRSPNQRKDHLDRDWFGIVAGAKQGGMPTGWWDGFQGDPEAILREGMIRAIEVSFGIAHGTDPVPQTPPRFWPIDVSWICQGPFFQCWIMWQTAQNAPNDGHVTLLITTPAGDGFPLTSKITRDKPATRAEWPDPEYADSRRVPPNDARSVLGAGAQNQRHGVWVVGHEDYRPQPGITILTLPEHEAREGDNCTKGTLVHQIPLPTLNWSATAKSVVCVRPSFWEGGVLGAGFPYVAPTP